jgi:hypothetical protein
LPFHFFLITFCLFALLTSSLLFYGEAFCAQVTLAWDPENVSGLAGYKIHYGTVSKSYSFTVDAGAQPTATITGLTDGATYYFAATAYNTAGTESAFSNEVAYTVPSSCSYKIAPASGSFTAAGGTGSVTVSTQSTCSWATANPASWITITSGAGGKGNGTVNYSVSANTGSSSRTAVWTLAGPVFTVTQQAGTATYTITASANSGGQISPSGAVNVAYGAGQTFTISRYPGYTIADVKVDGVSVGGVTSYSFSNVTANHTIAASFAAANVYTLTIAKTGTGTGTVTNSPSGTTFAQGTQVPLTATPGASSTFAGWSGACSGVSPTCTITMNSNASVTGTFSAKSTTYTITATAGAGGLISPPGTVTVAAGGTQAFSMVRNPGYTVADVKVDGVSVGAVPYYIFSNVTANHTISVSFK